MKTMPLHWHPIATITFLAATLMLGRAAELQAQTSTANEPSIQLRSGKFNCTVPLKNGKIELKNTPNCENDEANEFRLAGMQSGMLLTFTDEPNCSTARSWWFAVEMADSGLSTGWITLTDLNSSPVGGLITAGLYLHSKSSEPIKQGKLSCIEVAHY